MSRNVVETVLGAVVLLVAAGFLVVAFNQSEATTAGGYELNAAFDDTGGLPIGADVRISGIKVGTVLDQQLDPLTYRAKVIFTVREGIEMPRDSSATIASSSLLGGKYLSLTPGGDPELLEEGGTITLTQSSLNLEKLIGQAVFGAGSNASGGGSGGAGGFGGGLSIEGDEGDGGEADGS